MGEEGKMQSKKILCLLLGKKACKIKWFKNYIEEDISSKTKVLQNAKEMRMEAERKIDNMIAQINGCCDQWFLQPKRGIDDCMEEEKE